MGSARGAEAGYPIVASVRPDRRGSDGSAGRLPVRRILCLKLDHIGDVLIAAPALMLLRRSFPQAHITLVCGPWNVGLVRRLGVADAIVPAAIFSQNSLADMDHAAQLARRKTAVAELDARNLGAFDLAIDLRRDDDTREVLKLFDARIYAGIGDLETFSYLDVALPFTRHGVHDGAASLHLEPRDLDAGIGHRISDQGLHLTAFQGRVDLEVSTDAAWPPTDEGIADTRMLATALYRIDVRSQTGTAGGSEAREVTRNRMSFGPGWLDWEPWGRWSSATDATLTLRFTTPTPDVELLVRAQGHAAPSHPQATVSLRAPGAHAAHTFRTGEEPVSIPLSCRAEVSAPMASSQPFLLRPGRYQGLLTLAVDDPADWERLTLVVRSAGLANVIGKLVTPSTTHASGLLSFPFEMEHRDGAEPVIVEIQSDEHSAVRGRLAVVSVDLQCLQARSEPLPVTHVEAQLLDLAAMVALRYAPELVAPGEEVGRRLSQTVDGSTAAAAVERIRARRGGRRILGLKTPDRRIIGVGVGANKDTKRWPQDYFLELCRRLLGKRGVDLVFIGGPKEADEVGLLVAQLAGGERVMDLCGCCRIEDLGEMLAELDGFIGLDTGTTHFAGRVGVKTLALFGASHDPREWGPVGEKSAWAAVETPCRQCFKSELAQCGFGLQCMVLLKPSDVWPLVERQML